MAIRAVLSDLDDTLFDHWRGTRLALEAVRAFDTAFDVWTMDELEARHRSVLERWHLEVMAGRATIDEARAGRFNELLRGAGVDGDLERAHRVARAYREAYARQWHPVPGAVALLAALKHAGLQVAIVTNNVVSEQVLKLDRCGLAPHVDTLVTSEEIGVQKPERGIFDAALGRLGVDPGDAVMLGDAWHTDIVGALNAGIRPVWFNRFDHARPDLSNVDVLELRSLEPSEAVVRLLTRSSA